MFFYTDLPDLEACILLFGLFFNRSCSIVCDWGVYDLLGKGSQGFQGQEDRIVNIYIF